MHAYDYHDYHREDQANRNNNSGDRNAIMSFQIILIYRRNTFLFLNTIWAVIV